MKRFTILLAMLVLVVAGCSSQTDASADATAEPTPQPTAEPTAEATPTEEPESSDDGGNSGTDLGDLIPDEVAGLTRTDIPGMESIISSALTNAGVQGAGAEYAFASFGDGEQALIVTALRIPGLDEASLQTLAQAMAGAGPTGASLEAATVGGKSVLQMSAEGAPGAAFLYFADGAVFTVVGEDPDLAALLLAELP